MTVFTPRILKNASGQLRKIDPPIARRIVRQIRWLAEHFEEIGAATPASKIGTLNPGTHGSPEPTMPSDILSDFPADFDGPTPLFSADGSLPPGDFLPSRIEFETRFVNAGDLPRRASIYSGWNNHRDALIRDGLAQATRQLLDGSYTTTKDSPGDIDIAVEVPVVDGNVLRAVAADDPIMRLLHGPLMKANYLCDAYPIYTLPKTDPLHAPVTVRAIQYWTKWFGRTEAGTSKGRVWATTGGLR